MQDPVPSETHLHCHLCFERLADNTAPDTDNLPPLHTQCLSLLNAMPDDHRALWDTVFRDGTIAELLADRARLEAELDANELRVFGQNSETAPLAVSQAVERMVYALSLVSAGAAPRNTAETLTALAWKADHQTRSVTISDEELQDLADRLTPVVESALRSTRFHQGFILRRFLREQTA